MMKNMCGIVLLGIALCSTDAKGQNSQWSSLVTTDVKLDTTQGFNVYVADINNDRFPDLITLKGNWAIGSDNALRAYINIRDTAATDPAARMFVDITTAANVNAMPSSQAVSKGTIVAALADVNNDGNIDMLRGNYYHRLETFTDNGDRCEVLLGDGKGHFTLVPNGLQGLGLVNTTAFSFLDYNKDGNVDLFIATWFKDYRNDVWDHGYLMKGNGDGTFTNVTTQAGITEPEPMYGCSVVDWNNDGWPDIATGPYCRTRGQLWQNNGNGTFTNVAVAAGYDAHYMQGDNGQNLCLWNPAPEDFDNDGDMDFFFSLVHGGLGANEGRSVMMLNGGPSNNYRLTADRSRMTRKTPMSQHLGDYDASWFDMDNDGMMDLLMGQGYYSPPTDRLYVFHQKQDHTFSDITNDVGLVRTETKDIHALEVMDYDMDGDDDMITCKDGQPRKLTVVKNEIGQDNNWIAVHLNAPQGVNKSSIGARITVWTGGIQHMREVYAGRGNNGGQQPFALIFGLGSNTTVDSIQVRWPNAGSTITTVYQSDINQYITISANGLDVPGAAVTNDVGIKVYPNPAKDFVLVQLKDTAKDAIIEIYNVAGQKMHGVVVYDKTGATKYCSLKNLLPGQYIIKATTTEGEILSQSFTKLD